MPGALVINKLTDAEIRVLVEQDVILLGRLAGCRICYTRKRSTVVGEIVVNNRRRRRRRRRRSVVLWWRIAAFDLLTDNVLDLEGEATNLPASGATV